MLFTVFSMLKMTVSGSRDCFWQVPI